MNNNKGKLERLTRRKNVLLKETEDQRNLHLSKQRERQRSARAA